MRWGQSSHYSLFLSTSVILTNFRYSMILRLIFLFSGTGSEITAILTHLASNFSIVYNISSTKTLSELGVIRYDSFSRNNFYTSIFYVVDQASIFLNALQKILGLLWIWLCGLWLLLSSISWIWVQTTYLNSFYHLLRFSLILLCTKGLLLMFLLCEIRGFF